MKLSKALLGDFFGAFADAAVLFPLLAALSMQSGFSAWILLATAGLAYLGSAAYYGVPMSVQPLKSIAIAAVSIGATSGEVRWAGALLGFSCLLIALFNIEAWARNIPRALIHGVQASLGVLLILQGLQFSTGLFSWACLLVLAIFICDWAGFGIMGALATAGVIWAMTHASAAVPKASSFSGLRLGVVMALALPQLALTFSNSVLGTADAAQRYFGPRACKVTVPRLLQSIGFGNIAASAVGGLPFCHGSGGLTAHVRGGATTWRANIFIGSFLLGVAIWQYGRGGAVLPYPPILLAALLGATGFFHLGLARPSWNLGWAQRFQLIAMGFTVLVTRNILYAFLLGVTLELYRRFGAREPQTA